MEKIDKIYKTKLIDSILKDGMRLDGRSFNDYRPIQVQFEKINNSYGSCQLTLVILLIGTTFTIFSLKLCF